jgi:hypothetical protein
MLDLVRKGDGLRRRRSGCVVASVGLLALCLACYSLWNWPTARDDTPDILNLVLDDASTLPEGWELIIGPIRPPEGKYIEGEREAASAHFERVEGHPIATHRVMRYPNALRAAEIYFTTDEFARHRNVRTPWRQPADWSYESAGADRLRFACAEIELKGWRRYVRCTAVAQYGEYVSVFTAPMSPYFMKVKDFEPILRAIDERVLLHLGDPDSH